MIVPSTFVLACPISAGPLEDAFSIKENVDIDVLAIVATINAIAMNGLDVILVNGPNTILDRCRTKICFHINMVRLEVERYTSLYK